MTVVDIRRCAVDAVEHAPNSIALLSEYAAESSIAQLGTPAAQWATYRQLVEAGSAHFIGAFQGDDLVGFLVMLVAVLPHYGLRVASTESFFVARTARKSGAGLQLLHEAEQLATELGAAGFFVSAPTGGRLAKVLPGVGFAETNQVFFKGITCSPE